MCLYGHEPESGWAPGLLGADALDRLRGFIDAANRSEFPRADVLPLEVPFARVSVHPNLVATVRSSSTVGAMHGMYRPDGRLLVVTSVENTTPSGIVAGLTTEKPTLKWQEALGLVGDWHGFWCRVSSSLDRDLASLHREIPSRERLDEWLTQRGITAIVRQAIQQQPALMLVGEPGLLFMWLKPPEGVARTIGDRVVFSLPVEENIPERIFARADARLDNASHLRRAHVAVVGTGSLGGTVAIALARAGIGRFTLFDGEALESENIARHVGSLRDLGLPKVDAVARAITRINPSAEIKPVRAALSFDPEGWHMDTVRQLAEVISEPVGIVVCTTASAQVENVLNSFCVSHGAPAVYSVALGDAEHGRIFRVLPRQTPCYECILLAQAKDIQRYPKFDRADIGAPAYASGAVPGLGIDVDEIAMITARLTLQTIALQIPGGLGYPAAHGDHFLWSARGGWAVDGPLQVRVERIAPQDDCTICGRETSTPTTAVEDAELARLLARAGSPPPA